MPNQTPADFFGDGYSADNSSHTITFETFDAGATCVLPEVTDGEADTSSGDYRKVVYGILEALHQNFERVKGTTTASTRIKSTRNSYEDSDGAFLRTYKFVVSTTASQIEVKNE
jgi:hypothetical protein